MRSLKSIVSFFLVALSFNVWAQCSTTPVVEAVRNGDFEQGYLPGSVIGSAVNSHTYTPGSDFDFQSALQYAGKWNGPNSPCSWGMANQYGVGRSEKSTNNCDTRTMPVYGRYSQVYRDHTLGTNKGFALFVDFHQNAGYKVTWAQTVDVFPSQLYYFSAWFAQYGGNQTPPTLRFRVITYDAGGVKLDEKIVGTAPVKAPAMAWQQFNGQYNTPANAVTAKIFIDCKPTGTPSQDDFLIDDISFINGCQNIASDIAYQVEFPDEVASLCYNNGSYNAQIKKDDGSNLGGGKTITWYKGAGTSQVEVPSLANNQAPTLTTTGTYRACVVDPVNSGCTVNSTIVISDTMSVELTKSADISCVNPAQIILNTNRTETGLLFDWKRNGSMIGSNVGNKTVTVDGNYSLDVSLPSISNCTASAIETVTAIDNMDLSHIIDVDLCNPTEVIYSTGYNELSYTNSWKEGSNTVGSVESLLFDQAGSFTVEVNHKTVPSCSKSIAFEVTSSLPIAPTGLQYCLGNPVELEMGGNKKWKWLEDDKITEIGTENGSPIVWAGAPTTIGNYKVSLQSAETTPLTPALGGASFPTYPVAAQAKNIAFTVTDPVVLQSFVVNAEAWVSGCNAVGTKTNGVFSISGPVNYSVTKQLNCGALTTVTVNWTLPPGNYVLNTNKNLKRKPTFGTTSIPGYVTVKSSNNRVYGTMKFAASKSCEPVLVDIEAKNCCTAATITSQPSNVTVCTGDGFTLSTNATGTGTKTYQWQVSVDNGATWSNVSNASATTKTLTFATSVIGANDNQYRAEVKLGGTCAAYSNAATLTVNAVPTISNTVLTESICGGTSSTGFTLTSNVSNTSYAWTSNATGVTGATASGNGNLPVENLSRNGSVVYSVIPTGPAPGSCIGNSVDFTVSVKETPNVPTIAAAPAITAICGGESITLNTASTTTGSDFIWSKGTASGSNNQSVVITSGASSDAGTYTTTASKVYGGLTCISTSSAAFSLTVNASPSINTTNPSAQCAGNYNLSNAVSGAGSATLSYWDAVSSGNMVTNPVTTTGTYYVEAEENSCKSTRKPVVVTIDETISLTTASPAAVCAPASVNIASSATPSGAMLTYYNAAGGSGGSGGTITGTVVTTAGNYSVEAVNGTCVKTEDIQVTINPLPTGLISIDKAAICNNGPDQATITLTGLGGTGPYTIDYEKALVPVQATNVTSTETVTTKLEETFSIIGVKDMNSCSATDLGNPVSVSSTYIIDPTVVNQRFECKPSNPVSGAPGVYEYRTIVSVALGDLSTYNISGTFGGGAVNGSSSGSIWTSDWVVEATGDQFSMQLTDANACNPIAITGDTVCSCPESATLAIASGSPATVCVQGDVTTTDITISFNDGGTGASAFAFNIYKDGALVQSEAAHDGSDYNLANQSYGVYTISGLTGTCTGASNTLKVDSLQSPTGSITAIKDTLCAGVDNANIQLVGGLGQSPWNFTINGQPTAVAPTTNLTPSTGGVFTVSEIKDDNGCIAENVSGFSVTIGEVTPPTGSITVPKLVTTGASDNHVFNPAVLTITASEPLTKYRGQWDVSGAVLGSSVNQLTNTVKDMDFGDQATITWTVSDKGTKCPPAVATLIVDRKNVTVADVSSDEVCSDFSGYTLIGNGLVTGETASWSVSGLSSISGLTVIPVAGTNGKEAMVSGYTITPGVISEEVIFEYTVNPVVGLPTTDTMKVMVYATPISNPGMDETICGNSYQLKAPSITTGSGFWSDDKGEISYDDKTLNTATVSNLPKGSPGNPVEVVFTLTVSNGVCASVSNDVTIKRSGDLTDPDPRVNVDEVCVVGGNVTLSGNDPIPNNDEASSWSVSPLSNVVLSSTPNVADASASFNAVGVYTFTYSMNNPTCPQTDKSVIIEVKDTAYLSTATIDLGCEGEEVDAVASGLSSSTDEIVWSSISGALLSGSEKDLTTQFILLEDGSVTSTIQVTPSNAICGPGSAVQASNTINLKPKQVPVINGEGFPCGSNQYVFDQPVPTTDATSWLWEWNGVDKGASATLTLNSSDLVGNTGLIYLTPVNNCGEGVAGLKVLNIKQPKAPQVALSFSGTTSDGKVCEDEEDLLVEVDLGYSNGGTNATYEYFNGLTQIGNATSATSLTIPQGNWKDGDNITVEMTPDVLTGCFVGAGTPVTSSAIRVEGFNIPAPQLISSSVALCENKGSITLSVLKNDSKGDFVKYWDGPSGEITGLVDSVYGVSKATDRGSYSVTVENPECITTGETNIETIMIYEQPQIQPLSFVNDNNDLVLNIEEEGQSVIETLPVYVSGLNKDLNLTDNYTWNSERVLVSQDQVDFSFEADGETDGFEYISLIVTNGVGAVQCIDSIDFNISISLPLGVPNAFSPNGDGINDTWEIQGMNDYPDAHVSIYNRWGAKIYERYGGYTADQAWDGGGAAIGTYYYILKLNIEGEEVIRGAITITK